MLVMIITLVATIYLSSYVVWTIWDQRNLLRQQKVEEAAELAWSGLNRAMLDLSLDGNSWLDGDINGHSVNLPDNATAATRNAFYLLYNGTPENVTYGNYSVEMRYLYNNVTNKFYDKRMWVRSTGFTPNASRLLERIVDLLRVKNLTRDILYASLQTAVNEANDNDDIAVDEVTLSENVTITSAAVKNFNITGCYNSNFSNSSCGNYHSYIIGNVTVTGNAVVNLSGVTIE